MTNGTGLTGETTTGNGGNDVELTGAIRGNDRLLQDHLQDRTCEILLEFLVVDGDLAGARLDPYACNGILALAGGVSAALCVQLLDMNRSGSFGLGDSAEFFERVDALSHDYAFPLFLRFSAATSRTSGC